MGTRSVIKIVVSGLEQPERLRGGSADDTPGIAPDELGGDDSVGGPLLDHRELDMLLLREARRTATELNRASVALQAASAVVLEAVAALHEERGNR